MKKGFIISTTWMLMIVFFGLFLMLGVLFFTLYSIYDVSELMLSYPDAFDDAVTIHVVSNCFAYENPYTLHTYSYLIDTDKMNINNLTSCTRKNLKVSVSSSSFSKTVQSPDFVQTDSQISVPVIIWNNQKKLSGEMKLEVDR